MTNHSKDQNLSAHSLISRICSSATLQAPHPVAAILCLWLAGIGGPRAAAQESMSTDFAVVDPSHVEGHALCIDCHKAEVNAWLESKHATRAFDLLRTASTSLKYAEELDIRPEDIARSSACVNCHATPMTDVTGRHRVIPGVSCESCHNAAGGQDGWLNVHAVYGFSGTRREQESADHYHSRVAKSEAAGQLRSENIYFLAKRCFACHVVSDNSLAATDHDQGDGFELVAKMMGEVRHNMLLDPHNNADVSSLWSQPLHHGNGSLGSAASRTTAGRLRVVFVVGQLVDLETSLRSLAAATEESDFTDLLIDRIEEAYELLAEDLLEELEDTELPQIEQAIEAATPAFEKIDDDGYLVEDSALYLDAAVKVGAAAEIFGRRDGSGLQEIDALELLPEGPFEGVYQP